MKLNIEQIKTFAENYGVPFEDALFISLNLFGVTMDVTYNRMRTAFHLNGNDSIFSYAADLNELDYYFALAVNPKSPFRISEEVLYLDNYKIGKTIGATEDFCDSHYPRRLGTSLNINPNSRTSCRGCEFCYTAYQVPHDRKRMESEQDIREFFYNWINKHDLSDLSHLIQVSVVTGCYQTEKDLLLFLLTLNNVLKDFNFQGRIFYLGSMLVSSEAIQSLREIPSFGYCVSLECFERRHLLKDSKRELTLVHAKNIMRECVEAGMEVNYTYVIGIESHDVFLPYMQEFIKYTTKFPTINVLQLHQQHNNNLLDPTALDLGYFLEARVKIEKIFLKTTLRPLVWEDYRSLWYLRFGNEILKGFRVPE
ncbi:MAG: hypothetical protein KKG99_11235 [Bacteroidetes bacterium]|nr:hypothetical protein [Bacteroidota bacterium]